MRGEGVGQAELRGELRAEQARTEDPERHVQPGAGHGLDCLVGARGSEIGLQFEHVLGEAVGGHRAAAHRPHRHLVGAGRPAEAEIDAAGKERFERAELLGDDQRGVVRQHDAAGADADGLRRGGELADDDGGGGAGDADHVVMLGDPVAGVAEGFRMAGEVDRGAQRIARLLPFAHGNEVENGDGDHGSLGLGSPGSRWRSAFLDGPSGSPGPVRARPGHGASARRFCRLRVGGSAAQMPGSAAR